MSRVVYRGIVQSFGPEGKDEWYGRVWSGGWWRGISRSGKLRELDTRILEDEFGWDGGYVTYVWCIGTCRWVRASEGWI